MADASANVSMEQVERLVNLKWVWMPPTSHGYPLGVPMTWAAYLRWRRAEFRATRLLFPRRRRI
jgi:hypothetical protein